MFRYLSKGKFINHLKLKGREIKRLFADLFPFLCSQVILQAFLDWINMDELTLTTFNKD